jgi:hypothetical protein
MPWLLSNPYGIVVDVEADAWHTGAATAVLPVQNTQELLIGSETGGVWRCSPTDEAATALSDGWTDPDITALIQSPDPVVVLATTGNGSVYISDQPSAAGSGPLGTFRQARTVNAAGAPVTPGTIWAGVIEPTTNRLVLACQNGLFWAELPLAGDDLVFAAAVGATGPFSGVALGPAKSIIAAGHGSAIPGLSGLFVGSWTRTLTGSLLLRLKPAQVNGPSVSLMGRTSVASCFGSPRFAFAVTAQAAGPNEGLFYAVLRSLDGGQSWNVCGQAGAFANAGNQADRNEAIAVAPQPGAAAYQQLNVAMGMRRGPFISSDGGDNWVEHGDTWSGSGKSPHLHEDTRTLLFDDRDSSGNTLYVGSDGGVACTRDLGASWETRPFNSRLPILQFYGSNRGGYRGGASATPAAEVAGGGLQDNENVCSLLRPQPEAWRELNAGGDGGYVCFVRRDSWGNLPQSGVAVCCNANAGRALELGEWNGQQLASKGVIPVKAAGGYPPAPSGITATADQYLSLSTVSHPAWPDRHRRVITVCGSGSTVYGFVQTGGIYGAWLRLASLPLNRGEFITAVGSRTGDPIYVGSSWGGLFAIDPNVDPDQASVLELQFSLGRVARAALGGTKLIVHAKEDLVLAMYDRQLLRMQGLHFQPVKQLPVNESLTGLVYDERAGALYSSFDAGVFRSVTAGDSWQPFSQGLPKMAHAAELFIGETGAGRFLYLATWGRSLFHSDL